VRINEIQSTKTPTESQLLKKHFKVDGTIGKNTDLSITIRGNIELKNSPIIDKLPITFKNVTGGCFFGSNGLITLEGGPQIVGGGFYCVNNKLTSLEGGPTEVGGDYWCNHNPLVTLAGLPTKPFNSLFLTYSPKLPLMRTLVASKIVFYQSKTEVIQRIEELLNKYAGQGKAGIMKCSSEILTLGKKLGVDLRQNARW